MTVYLQCFLGWVLSAPAERVPWVPCPMGTWFSSCRQLLEVFASCSSEIRCVVPWRARYPLTAGAKTCPE